MDTYNAKSERPTASSWPKSGEHLAKSNRASHKRSAAQITHRTDLLNVWLDIATAANKAQSAEETLRFALERVCVCNDWHVGHVYLVSNDRATLVPSSIWYTVDGKNFERFQRVTMQTSFAKGEDYVGRVFESGRSQWVNDIQQDPHWLRSQFGDLGVHAAFLAPVGVDSHIFAVLEFYADHALEVEDEFVNVMSNIGVELGHVCERDAAIGTWKRLATVVRDSNDAITVQNFDGRIMAWNRGAELMYGYCEDEALQMNRNVLIPENRREEIPMIVARLQRGELIDPFETRRITKDGQTPVVCLTITVLTDDNGQPMALATTERDISDTKRFERELAEVTEREQQRIGRDLHDGLGQHIWAIGMLAASLQQHLEAESPPRVHATGRLVTAIEDAKTELRRLAGGLMSSDISADGLHTALGRLAELIQDTHGKECTFECSAPVTVSDSLTATHLYRIVQEAVHNALRHAQAQHIHVRLDGGLPPMLEVRDDGIGIQLAAEKTDGLGLRIMQYRASLIDAKVDIQATASGGTVVTCTF